MDGDIDIEGDLRDALTMGIELMGEDRGRTLARFLDRQRTLAKREQVAGVQHHYDLGNDFFRLWLDETMSCSCAYFRSPDDSLRQAQLQKIDHSLKKLQLREGQSILDIGSGWGHLILRAA